MRLTGIDCQIPSNKVSNEDILELVKFYSSTHYSGNIGDLESIVRRFLNLTGIKTRFWRNKKEKPIDLLKIAAVKAMDMAGIHRHEIDLVIYSSIDRGFIEPANASFICKALGLENTRCFDIVDACMGWGTAVQTAYSFLHSDSAFNSIMIINSEFPMDQKGSVLPSNFTIHTSKELGWKSPSFTLGEAVSVCIFQRDDSKICRFEFIENSQFANKCTIPLSNFEKYIEASQPIDFPIEMQFYAFGSELLKNGMSSSVDVLNKLLNNLEYEPKILFPHSVSSKVIQDALLNSKVKIPVCSTFSELGNLATASIPSSIHKALLNQLLKKDEKAIIWIASAGMKFCAFEISL